MNLKVIIGSLLVASPFIGLFILMGVTTSFKVPLIIFGILFLAIIVLVGGLELLEQGTKNDLKGDKNE